MNARMLIAVIVSMFVCQQVHAQDEPVMPEATELEGTWEVVSFEFEGVHLEGQGQLWRFEGNRRYFREGDDIWFQYDTFSVDPSVMPAEIDWPGGWPGIYELDGDSLTICLGRGFRPDAFESTDETILWVIRRVEDDE